MCQAQGWDLNSYLAPTHPLQQAVLKALTTVTATAKEDINVAVDGCSAPTFRLPLHRLAALYAQIAEGVFLEGPPARNVLTPSLARLGKAMQKHPTFVAGTQQFDTGIMESLQCVAKRGAEGIQAIGLFDHRRNEAVGRHGAA